MNVRRSSMAKTWLESAIRSSAPGKSSLSSTARGDRTAVPTGDWWDLGCPTRNVCSKIARALRFGYAQVAETVLPLIVLPFVVVSLRVTTARFTENLRFGGAATLAMEL